MGDDASHGRKRRYRRKNEGTLGDCSWRFWVFLSFSFLLLHLLHLLLVAVVVVYIYISLASFGLDMSFFVWAGYVLQ